MFEIESRSDLTGAMLVIRFPEADLDEKALYTIQASPPDFLIPFRYRCLDGEAECTYQLGNRVRLPYFYGSRTPRELADFWNRILQPLLDCGDWFLKPFSFVLDTQYLYMDKEGKNISYLYVPSKRDCSDMESLKGMATELSQKNPSTDPKLEIKVLRAIMQDFQPKTFLQMLQQSLPGTPAVPPAPLRAVPAGPEAPARKMPEAPAEGLPPVPSPGRAGTGEISIDLSGGGKKGKKEKEKKEKKGLFGRKNEKKKEGGGLFGKGKEPAKEIVLGAAADTPSPAVKERPALPPVLPLAGPEEDEEVTVVGFDAPVGMARLRLAGAPGLPAAIPVPLEPGGMFTIGRFDVKVGRRQSDFEFDARTKEISRRHAVIERDQDGYLMTDLNSSAGTFVDGQRLQQNIPHRLSRGCQIAFGSAGANYIWEE